MDIPNPGRLWESASRMLPMSLFTDERGAYYVHLLGRMDPNWKLLLKRSKDYRALLGAFDKGVTCATLIGKDELFWNSLAGSVSGAARRRAQGPLVAAMLAGPEPQDLPLADSPVQARYLTHKNATLFYAQRPRRSAFLSRYSTAADDPDRAEAAELLAAVIGLAGRGTPEAAPATFPAPAQSELLARLVIRPEILGMDDPTETELSFGTVLATAALAWKRVEARLYRLPDGSIREHLDLQRSASMEKLPDMLVRSPRGLGDAAAVLPANALAAAYFCLNSDDRAQALYERLAEMIEMPVEDTRALMTKFGFGGKTKRIEIALAVLRPSAGSPLPEPAVLFRFGEKADDAARRLMQLVASVLATRGGLVKAEDAVARIKTLGRGADAVPYVRFLEFFGLGEAIIYKMMFGGGFLSTTRAGSWVVLGCNPRAVREVARAWKRGDVLAKRPGFAEKFPPGNRHLAAAFLDFESLATMKNAFSEFMAPTLAITLPLLMSNKAENAGVMPIGPLTPTARNFRSLMGMLGQARLYVDKTKTGHVVVHEGSMLASPTTWCALWYGISLHDVLCELQR